MGDKWNCQQTFRSFSENVQKIRLIARQGLFNQISLYFASSQPVLDASCYKTLFHVMKNGLPPTCDFQISLTINCGSTWPGLTMFLIRCLIIHQPYFHRWVPDSCKGDTIVCQSLVARSLFFSFVCVGGEKRGPVNIVWHCCFEILWARSICTTQQAFAYSQKPLKIIPRICRLPEQHYYAMFTRPFSPPTHKRKKSSLATRD